MFALDRVTVAYFLWGAPTLILLSCATVPQGVRVSVDAPRTVRLGDRFEIIARVENFSAKQIRLVDLDIADSYVEGIAIESTRPRFRELIHVPIDNTMSYRFEADVDAEAEWAVSMQATAEREGLFSGDFDFCINSAYSCLSFYVRTAVER